MRLRQGLDAVIKTTVFRPHPARKSLRIHRTSSIARTVLAVLFLVRSTVYGFATENAPWIVHMGKEGNGIRWAALASLSPSGPAFFKCWETGDLQLIVRRPEDSATRAVLQLWIDQVKSAELEARAEQVGALPVYVVHTDWAPSLIDVLPSIADGRTTVAFVHDTLAIDTGNAGFRAGLKAMREVCKKL